MREDENIVKHVERIKTRVSAIKAFGGKIESVTVLRKVLIQHLLNYGMDVGNDWKDLWMKNDGNGKEYFQSLFCHWCQTFHL